MLAAGGPFLRAVGISIVIPARPACSYLAACVQQLLTGCAPDDELLIVIDGSGTPSLPLDARIRRLETGLPAGPAAARNQGARAARHDVLFFVDADVHVPAAALARIRAHFTAAAAPAAVIGSYDDAPGDPAFLSQYRNLLHHYVHQNAQREASTFWGACGAIRRSVFQDVGGFDERYATPSVEDIEFGYRLTAAGHAVRLDPALQVKHMKRWTFATMTRTDFAQRAVPWLLLLLRAGQAPRDLNLRLRDRVSVAAVCLACVTTLLAVPGGAFQLVSPLALVLCSAAPWALFISINMPLFRFLADRRGPGFAMRAVACYAWLQLLSAAAVFTVAPRAAAQLLTPQECTPRRPSFKGDSAS